MVRKTVSGIALLALAGLTACDSYLIHIARGQSDLLNRARPIGEVIGDPTTPAVARGCRAGTLWTRSALRRRGRGSVMTCE